MDEKEDALFQTYPDLLDLLLMLAAYSERFGGYRNGKTPEERTSIASILAIYLHKSFPPRMKPCDTSQMMKMMLYDGIARRKLERMIKAQARKAGIPRGKARIFPSVRQFMANLE